MRLAILADVCAARIMRLVILAASCVGPLGCTQEKSTPPVTQQGEGPLLYWNQDLRAFDAHGQRVAAVTIGLSDLEVLDKSADGPWNATTIARPDAAASCSPGFPVADAVLDVNDDGAADVLVFDACGNWIALGRPEQSGFDAVAWEDVLPAIQTAPYLEVFSMPDSHAAVRPLTSTPRGIGSASNPRTGRARAPLVKPSDTT